VEICCEEEKKERKLRARGRKKWVYKNRTGQSKKKGTKNSIGVQKLGMQVIM
jgi:hypothetical protein